MLETIVGNIVPAVLVAVGAGLVAYFRKIQKTNSDLCRKVERLQKTILVLAKVIDAQVRSAHPETESDLDDLVKEMLYENK